MDDGTLLEGVGVVLHLLQSTKAPCQAQLMGAGLVGQLLSVASFPWQLGMVELEGVSQP